MKLEDVISTSSERMKELGSIAEQMTQDPDIEMAEIMKAMISECADTDEAFLVGWWMGLSHAKSEMKVAFKQASDRSYV